MRKLSRFAMSGVAFSLLLWLTSPGLAASQASEIEALKGEIEELRRRDAENRATMEKLLKKVEALEKAPPKPIAAPEEPAKEVTPPQLAPPALWSRQVGGTTYRLIDLSFDLLTAVGSSTEKDANIQLLQAGGHDPRQRGFTLQALELSAMGAVDPYFTAEAHLVYFIDEEGESRFELEEAFFTTTSLPYGLQLEVGHFHTEFGRINPQHAHQWRWLDQPFINSRLFGADALRQVGVRLGWLTPLPWFSEVHVGVQHPRGETMVSFFANDEVFEARAIGGRPFVERDIDGADDMVWLVRWNNSWDVSPEVTSLLGFSALFGPNATGRDGQTVIYGADILFRWRPTDHFRGWPFLEWQTEIMNRDYKADDFSGVDDMGNPIVIAGDTLRDWGLYTQLLYGFAYRWAAGLRYEYGTGSGSNVDEEGNPVSRAADPFRSDRYRISPLIIFHPTEFSRIRLQYNYDHADFLVDEEAHSVWLGAEVFFGAHAAHKY
ncbi:MAG: hypothetical protein U1B94_05915 [candidate division NC10 bacterium]|nr:hypothetical protein [candidate division NC10 bacterium]